MSPLSVTQLAPSCSDDNLPTPLQCVSAVTLFFLLVQLLLGMAQHSSCSWCSAGGFDGCGGWPASITGGGGHPGLPVPLGVSDASHPGLPVPQRLQSSLRAQDGWHP
jgi:hypothetical protein